MSTITANIRFALSVQETFTEAEMPCSKNRTITDDQFNASERLDAATTPPATKSWAAELSGCQTIDLTSLARSVGPTVVATNLQLLMILLNNLSTTASLTIAAGASNGYVFQGASGSVIVPPGGRYQQYFADGLAAVDSTHKTLDVTVAPAGSGTEVEDFQIQLVFG